MSLIQVGLVDQTKKLDPMLVQGAAAALNVQVIQDLPRYWPITASVQYLASATHIPPGVWPVFLVASLPPGEGGFHMDKHNQPYAKVIASPASEEWTIDASHEILEMLVDPYGNRMQTGGAIKVSGNGVADAPGQFNYLVEAADPCEADNYGYAIHGIAVSDFITPHFYDPVVTPGTKYSFTGAIPAPRRLLPGGYISYVDLETNEWQQILWVDPSQPPQVKQLGPAENIRSFRIWIDNVMYAGRPAAAVRNRSNEKFFNELKTRRDTLANLAKLHGSLYK